MRTLNFRIVRVKIRGTYYVTPCYGARSFHLRGGVKSLKQARKRAKEIEEALLAGKVKVIHEVA